MSIISPTILSSSSFAYPFPSVTSTFCAGRPSKDSCYSKHDRPILELVYLSTWMSCRHHLILPVVTRTLAIRKEKLPLATFFFLKMDNWVIVFHCEPEPVNCTWTETLLEVLAAPQEAAVFRLVLSFEYPRFNCGMFLICVLFLCVLKPI